MSCPSCNSPDPRLYGGACEDPFHDPPRPRSRGSSGRLSAYLRARGWERDDAPADLVLECGASSDTVGYCEKRARWSLSGPGSRGPLCAEHARQAQDWLDAAFGTGARRAR